MTYLLCPFNYPNHVIGKVKILTEWVNFYYPYQSLPDSSSSAKEGSKESWPRGPGFGYPQKEFALLKVH